MSEFPDFDRLSNMPLYFVYPHCVYLFICRCTVGFFLPIGSVNDAAVTVSVQIRSIPPYIYPEAEVLDPMV